MPINQKRQEQRENFVKRFGPEELKKFSGAALLKLIAAPKMKGNTQDSPKYLTQLEYLRNIFGKDFIPEQYSSMYQALEHETQELGGASGSQNRTREVFYNQKTSSWQIGDNKVSLNEAIAAAEHCKTLLVQGTDYLKNNEFNKFYEFANKNKDFFGSAFIHKYLYICYPQWIILDYHKSGCADNFYKEELNISTEDNNLFSLENYFFQKNPDKDFIGIQEQLEKDYGKFNIANSNIFKFIKSSRENWKSGKATGKRISGTYKGTEYHDNRGQGAVANTTFMAFLAYNQKPQNGIYPVILFDKGTQQLEVCYGISAKNKPNKMWPSSIIENLDFSKVPEYSDSKVFKTFAILTEDKEINGQIPEIVDAVDQVISDFHHLFKEKENVMPLTSNNSSEIPLNQILFGPPGTGKTYKTVIKALQIIHPDLIKEYDNQENKEVFYKEKLIPTFNKLIGDGRIKFITFHQNYSYEEFIGGIRPDLNEGNKTLSYEYKDGILKEISDKALLAHIEPSNQAIDFDSILSIFQEQYPIGTKLETKDKSTFEITDFLEKSIRIKPLNGANEYSISYEPLYQIYLADSEKKLEGPKQLSAELKGRYKGLSSYYFAILNKLRNIKPKKNTLQESDENTQKQILKDFYKDIGNNTSLKESAEPYVLIIDEINRGNISKIFGELITLIEKDKRIGKYKLCFTVELPYKRERFGIPDNLYILGTMNTADKSIAFVDAALRRRFVFEEMMPNAELLTKVISGFDLKTWFKNLNQSIARELDRDHQIGHSYFLKNGKCIDNEKDFCEVFYHNIVPLLQEYFYGETDKLRALIPNLFDDKNEIKHLSAKELIENLTSTENGTDN